MTVRRRISATLPDFPWDTVAAAKATAAAHPDGIVDLSVGTPVDPVDPVIREALATASDFPGYPTTSGTPDVRRAAADALARRHRVTGVDESAVLPVIGTKEAIAGMVGILGFGAGDRVAIPDVAYPTYEVAALLAGAAPVRESESGVGDAPVLRFVNSPSNPTGRVAGVDESRDIVARARRSGEILVSDECYLGLCWDTDAVSVLDPRVCDGDHTNLIAVHSLSKSSNLASYRAGFLAGDPALVGELLAVRKHAGLIMPYPIQAAMTAALGDDAHVDAQRDRYRRRREVLRAAVTATGFDVDHSEAGLYLWVTRGEPCRATVDALAARGILAAPGDFYGPQGDRHVRMALTATDERIEAAAARLAG